ncbi:MAG: amidohydrolase family protein [Bdellovibrionales bacterium]|nr:amidohydrolase family protein [Bdellovibrionales bacterium]
MKSTLLKGGWIVTMNARRDHYRGDVLMRGGIIVAVGKSLNAGQGTEVISADDCFVIPGLIQAHTHLVQTLFRGMADDMELLDWLKERIWPFESAHDENSIRASAQIGLLEMQMLGTTSILDMGTVRLHEVVFAEAERSGMRYWGGNCLMDKKSHSGPLYRPTRETLAYCEKLIREWHRKTPLLQYAISPRFAISCSQTILKAAAKLQKKHDLVLHTHASENRGEVQLVRKLTGMDNIKYLQKLGCLTPQTVIAHGIHMNASELKALLQTQTGICHCPSSNLKLASGVAKIHSYRQRGLKVALGADGAPCNNMLDPFVEMRLAALLQKPHAGPTSLPAREAFELATLQGAQVLGAQDSIGSIEPGKRADIVVVSRSHPSVATVEDPYSALVYSCSGRDVRDVWIDGKGIVRDGVHQVYNSKDVITNARRELKRLSERLT